MNRIIRLITPIVFALLAFAVSAQKVDPIVWRANVKMLTATEGEVIIKATIAEGWHLYGMDLPKGGPKSTVIDLSKSSGVKFVGKIAAATAPISKMDMMFNLKLSYWSGTATFRQKFKVVDRAKAAINGTVTFMGCNDVTCLPPSTFKFNKQVPVK